MKPDAAGPFRSAGAALAPGRARGGVPGPSARQRLARTAGRHGLGLVACVLAFGVHWFQSTFGEVSVGQLLFHWHYLGGAESATQAIGADFLVQCLLWPGLLAALFLWADLRLLRPLLRRNAATIPAALRRWGSRLATLLPLLVIAGALGTLAWRLSVWQYLRPADAGDFFAQHYLPPARLTFTVDKKPRNLVLVYVESLETAYRRTDVFGRDLLASLTALHPLTFDAYEQLPGTGYTIAALVSTQCAVPLQIVGVLDWQKQGEKAPEFLPGATCLGDLLAAHGYRNVFMGGASLKFSGKGKFLVEHHYQEAFGRDEWLRRGVPAGRMSGWGLHDDDLFAQARDKLRELHAAGTPFNLTLLTVDSHWPAGYLSPGCRARGAQGLDQIVECTAGMVAELIRFIRTEGWDADTGVVVIGDHLSPPNSLSDPLSRVERRTIYNGFFARDTPTPNRAALVHFDMLPTVLDFIGLHPDGGRVGLGFTAFGPPPAPFPTARSRAELGEHILAPSRAYLDLWEPDDAHAAAH